MKSNWYKIGRLLLSAFMITGATEAIAQCNAPTSISSTVRSCDSASITWSAVSGVAGYLYAVTTSPTPPGAGAAVTTNAAEKGGLYPSTLYYVHVKSNCNMTVSSWKTDTFRTPACPAGTCLPPASWSATTPDSTTADVTWPAVAGAIGYEYTINLAFPSPTTNGTLVTTNSAHITGLTGGTSYYFHIRTKCGPTSYSPWKAATLIITPGSDPGCTPVASIATTTPRCDSVFVTWPAVAGITNYGYSFTTSPTPAGMLSGSDTSFGRKNLLPSTQYYVHVRALCTNSKAAWTTTTFTTPSCGGTTCAEPATATSSNVTINSATVSWAAVTGAIGYEYKLDQTSANPTGNGTLVTTTNANITGLSSGTTYYLHVRTKCSASSFSSWKTAVQVKTPTRTSVSTTSGKDFMLSVYPSPANQTITIDLNAQPGKNAGLTIFSIDGRIVKTLTPATRIEADIRELQSGIYFVRYADQEINQVIRFTKK